jgi:hypothetical protein
MRITRTARSVLAGCFECWGEYYHWQGPNAQALAARHHDATGHETWADVTLRVRYGKPQEKTDTP